MKHLHAFLVLSSAATTAHAVDVHFVTDSTNDKVYRLEDLTADGDFNDAGEVVEFYSDALGSLVLTNNVGISCGNDGTVYVSDTSEDSVFAFRDFNGDGDANDPGEHVRFLDGRVGGNADGTLLQSANSLYVDRATNRVWCVNANSSTGGNDAIVRLVDLNGDGDANDVGESKEWWTAPAGASGDYLPNAVIVRPDGSVYYAESGSTGVTPKGIFRLVDLNADDDANDAGERTPYFLPPFTATPFYWCVGVDASGAFYTADTGNDVVWRFQDLNADDDAQDANESVAYWTVGAASNIWDVAVAANGDVYATDSMPIQHTFLLTDTDANGVIGAGEALEVYSDALSPVVIGNGRGIDLVGPAAAGVGFCFGDGTALACPCGNAGTAGKGCGNSIDAGGARVATQGVASVASDSLVLVGTGMPNSSALYFQGTSQVAGGAGFAFGDGLRCAGGSVIRLGTKVNAMGTSRYPVLGDLSISVKGANTPSSVRTYQIWYRNAAAFCNPETFNLSNGVQLTWGP